MLAAGSAQVHLTDFTDAAYMGTNDVLGGFIPPRRAFLSWVVHIKCQFVMFPVRVFSIASL